MRKKLIITGLMLCLYVANAQKTTTFSNLYGNIEKQTHSAATPVLSSDTIVWFIPRVDLSGCRMDTLKACKSELDTFAVWLSYYSSYPEWIGSLYADEYHEKLFFKNSTESVYRQIMDLTLSVGDTFRIWDDYYHTTQVLIVDSVFYENELKHIQFNEWIGVSSPLENHKKCFIEGVGPNWGLGSGLWGGFYFACKWNNRELFYSNSDYCFENCAFRKEICHGDGISFYEGINQFYPNPVSDVLHIPSSPDVMQYALYSVLGKPVREGVLLPGQPATINMAELPSGIYVFRYIVKGVEGSKKIIKY